MSSPSRRRPMADTDPVRYSDAITVRMQEGAAAFVQAKAREIGTKAAEIPRQALLAGLKSIGFDPAPVAPRDAGALYNVSEGKRRYALVDGDRDRLITWTDYVSETPTAADKAPHDGAVWLPLEFE